MISTEMFTVLMLIIQALLGIITLVIGLYIRNTRMDIRDLFRLTYDIERTMMNNYVRQSVYDDYRDENRDRFHKIYNDINELKQGFASLKTRVDERTQGGGKP